MVIEGGGGLERYAPAMDVPDSGDYTFTFSGRVNANSSSASNSLKFGVDKQSSGNSDFYKGIYFEETLSQVLGTGSGDLYSVDTSVNHNYQIIRESGVTSLYVDGGLAISDLPATPGNGGDNHEGLFVGSASRSIRSNSTWTLWQLEDGAHVIPEPATLGLFGLTCLVMFARRRR